MNQRRAMALAIDRQSLIDNIAQADQLPANGFTPKGMPGFVATPRPGVGGAARRLVCRGTRSRRSR